MQKPMTDTEIIERDTKGRFLSGTKAGPGRPVGSRNKLTENFVADLRDCWEVHGRDALERVARDEPATLLKVVASLMPKDISLSVTAAVDAGTFAEQFRAAVQLLGNEPPKMRTIENSNGRKQR
jgi:hypothetical protein